jgi:outer membrane protein assembly factor BamA
MVRGFEYASIGPRAQLTAPTATAAAVPSTTDVEIASVAPVEAVTTQSLSLGGTARTNLLLLLSVPMPFAVLSAFKPRAFVFANAG